MDAANEFSFNGEKKAFSIKKEIFYENKSVDICSFFSKGTEKKAPDFTKGRYKVEIYTDATLIGTSDFEFK